MIEPGSHRAGYDLVELSGVADEYGWFRRTPTAEPPLAPTAEIPVTTDQQAANTVARISDAVMTRRMVGNVSTIPVGVKTTL